MPISSVDSVKDSILVIAAEASSCMYAKLFLEEWRHTQPETHFFGVGDQDLSQNYKMECLGFAEDMAVVGLQEVISHWSVIKKSYYDVLKRCDELKPKFALLIDYPGFNLRLAAELKKRNIPVVYYVSPQLWAWKKGRVHKVKKTVDEMMVVFPFEVDFYREHGIQAHFVGHPIIEVIEKEKLDFLKTQNSNDKDSVSRPLRLGLMPGSRRSEIKFNLRTQLLVAQSLRKKYQIETQLLLAPTLKKEEIMNLAGDLLDDVKVLQEKPTAMILKSDLILSASGTATLQVALCEKPMVVMYRMNSITALLAKLLVRSVSYFCIVNLIAHRKVVPEFFQGDANVDTLTSELERYIVDPSHYQKSRQELLQIRQLLGEGKATQRLVSFLKGRFSC